MGDPLGTAASIISLLQLAAVATDYLKGIKDGAADRTRLRDELRSTTCLLEMLRDRIEETEDAESASELISPASIKSLAGPDSPLIIFRRTLEDIIAKLSPQSKLRQQSLSLTWPFTKKDIGEKLACLERLKSHFSLVMQNEHLELAQASYQIVQSSHKETIGLRQKLDDSHARFQDDHTQKIILWLSTLSFREQHIAIVESVQPGTGVWLTKHETFRNWLEGEAGMLWCPGIPGAGKTRLMSIVIDFLEREETSNGCLCTYVYSNYNRRKEQTSTALLSSLLQQVLQNSPSGTLPSEILSLYESHKKYGTHPTLIQLIDLLAKTTLAYKTLFVIIDALDKCTESEDEALQFLSTVRSIGSHVKILCSSRFSTTFEEYFASTKKLGIFARSEDIRTFLDSQISQRSRLRKHVRADPELITEIIDTITEECQGMFLLAKLHLESLSTKINRKAVRSALRTLPATLDSTYSEALRRIYDQPADTAELAEIVLFWVICAPQTLTVKELQHMYATRELEVGVTLEDDDLPDGDILIGACGGLITVDSESQAIHAIHYTLQQYFERALADKLMAAKLSLAKVSLAYLTLPNFSSGFCTNDPSMLQRLTDYPFLEYAARHWSSDIGRFDVEEFFPGLERLFSNPTAIEMASQAWSLTSSRRPNWSQEFPRKAPALVLAAAFDLPLILRQMVTSGHDIEGKGTDKETALIRASAFGHAENVRVLLELGASVDAQDYMGETALCRAARNGHAAVIQVLLDGSADVNIRASSKWTSLMSAVSSGSIDVVYMLVKAGAELMAETVWGDSASSMAVRSGQEAIAGFLADHNATLPRGIAGRRASIIASRRGLQGLVRRLTVNYEAVAGKPLQRQSSKAMSGLPAIFEEIASSKSLGAASDSQISQPEAQASDYEVSFAELMEQYDIKHGFSQRYSLGTQLGKGHMATVFSCSDKVTGVVVAVKIIESHQPDTWSTIIRSLLGEIQLLHELQKHQHPNLMRMIDIFSEYEKNEVCLVLDVAPGGELFELIVKQKLTEVETRTVFTQLFSAIQFLHDRGWVHRDIKPENILIVDEKSLTIQLGDFGLAKPLLGESGSEVLTTTLCGTPSYVAPEILEKPRTRKYGFGVDIWSSGVVLYICLCGFPPFSDELFTPQNPYTLAQQIKMGRFDYPSPYWDTVADSALDLIDQMLTVDPGNRLTVHDCMIHPWLTGKYAAVQEDIIYGDMAVPMTSGDA